jgi:hypothetical protein
MYDRDNDNGGVLNDFDLATSDEQTSPSGSERTGTVPFMALDLIHARHPPGSIKHEYRHDHESFAWTLLWIFGTFKDGREVSKPVFEDWVTNTYTAKYSLLGDLPIINVTKTFQKYWPRLKRMLENVHSRHPEIHADDERRQYLSSKEYQETLFNNFLSYAYPSSDDHKNAGDDSRATTVEMT